MSHAEALQILGQLFGVYVGGFFVAYVITSIKQFVEKI